MKISENKDNNTGTFVHVSVWLNKIVPHDQKKTDTICSLQKKRQLNWSK